MSQDLPLPEQEVRCSSTSKPKEICIMSVTWPLSENVIRKRKLSNTFGMVRNHGTKPHQGWDLEAPKGTTIYAIGDGSVVAVLGNSASKHGYGLQLLLSFEFNGKIY